MATVFAQEGRKGGGMKTLRRVIIGVVAGLVILLVVAYFLINTLVAKGVEKGATYALGAPTTVSGAQVNLLAGKVTLIGLDIGNPTDLPPGDFVTCKTAGVQVGLGSLMSDTVTVDEITIDGLVMTVQREGAGTNLQKILDNLKAKQSTSDSGEQRRYRIKHILIKGASTRFVLGLTDKPDLTLNLPDIEIKDLGTGENNAVKMSLVLLEVIGRMSEQAVLQSAGKLPADFSQSLNNTVQGAQKTMDDLRKGAGKALDDVLKSLPKLP